MSRAAGALAPLEPDDVVEVSTRVGRRAQRLIRDSPTAVDVANRPQEEAVSRLRCIALAVSAAALVSLPTVSTFAGISLNALD